MIVRMVRARSADNKLEIKDNRPFFISDVFILDDGVSIELYDIRTNQTYLMVYEDIADFRKEFEIAHGVWDAKYKDFKEIGNEYQE